MSTSDKAAHELSEMMLRMRIEVRKLAYDHEAHVEDRAWHNIYEAIRRYEDAQVRDMLNDTGRRRRQKYRRRNDAAKAESVPTETRRTPKQVHHPERDFSSPPKRRP